MKDDIAPWEMNDKPRGQFEQPLKMSLTPCDILPGGIAFQAWQDITGG
ncbi:MAG: hypothetical protein HY390_07675 [Deltaproteobacteria bacterium]|nr:hypothetical protein [Deltaproteobacteria bacterium]